MDITRDKLNSLIRKWQTLIEAQAEVKTTDGYVLRLFAIAFTKRRPNQIQKTSYATSSQIRQIRKKMVDIMTAEAAKSDLKELVKKFIPEALGKDMEKACQGIYPIQTCYIRKVKTIKSPRFDLTKLMEMHEGSAEDAGKALKDAPLVENMEGAGGRL
jgi:small subunit ribosomal protein S3Ae